MKKAWAVTRSSNLPCRAPVGLFAAMVLIGQGDASAVQRKPVFKVVKNTSISTFVPDSGHLGGNNMGSGRGPAYDVNGEGPKLRDLYATRTVTEFVDVFIDLVNSRSTTGKYVDTHGRYVIENQLSKYVQRAFDTRGGRDGGEQLTILSSKMKKALGLSVKLTISGFDSRARGRVALADETGTDVMAWKKGKTPEEMVQIGWRELGKLNGGTRHRGIHAKSHRRGQGFQAFAAEHKPLMRQYLKILQDPSLDEETRQQTLTELERAIVGPWEK